jgi:hypothetical protein
MPKKINMIISNGNTVSSHVRSLSVNTNLANNVSNALAAPMISRIHTIKPGCGSCGRK